MYLFSADTLRESRLEAEIWKLFLEIITEILKMSGISQRMTSRTDRGLGLNPGHCLQLRNRCRRRNQGRDWKRSCSGKSRKMHCQGGLASHIKY
jgi:hypothetical protein